MEDRLSDRARVMLVWPVAGFFVVVAFGVGLISMAAFGERAESAPASSSSGDVVEVELGDLFVKPEMIHAPSGSVTFRVHNSGGTQHNFVIKGVGSTPMIDPGDTADMTVDLTEGDYEVICAVPGHADSGMKADLMVGGDMTSSSEAATSSGMEGMTAEEMASHDAERTGMFPAETKGKGGIPLEPKILSDGTKRFELTADEIEWETEPGVIKQGMAYNGMIPGPEIRVDLGDKVEIVLHNKLDEPTILHLHGMTVPNKMDGAPAITHGCKLTGLQEGVDIFSIATATSEAQPTYPPSEWLEREGWTVPVIADDPGSSAGEAAGVTSYPFFVFVNGDGTVASRAAGELSTEAFEAAIASLSGGQ